MSKCLLPFLFLLICVQSSGQSDSSLRMAPTWFGVLNSGALMGDIGHGTSATASLIQGVRYKRVSLGAGAGYDSYRDWKTVPVFAAVSYDLTHRPRGALFLQLNSGYAGAWPAAGMHAEVISDSDGGFFHHPHIGYRIHQEKLALYFAVGYKFQRIAYAHRPQVWDWIGSSQSVHVIQDIERLSVHMGIGLK